MRKLTAWISIFLLCILSVAILLVAMGFRVNMTDSIPIGIYRMTGIKNLKNAFVIFCPEDKPVFQQARDRGYINNGFCHGNYGYLMKKVVATKGDKISVTDKGIFVNHQRIPFSKPILTDGMSRPLPQWRTRNYQLKEDEILTMTNQSAWSFDSRYYGPVHTGQIKGMITPVWVKATMEK
ncbi:conjugative transfer signal peptidase TraF [Legionella pneumophila]|uniref:conjugative transfer signal peptidase TraF n=1 Tax=Legionella pneumophila TaxID=446 RepID=UPI000770997E|nr:conjugative transfer signal peptidase TraF [Legionella pneumophila]CZP18995.1 conjugal transfer peptidase TraF [Legionella pneumophila]CZP47892.1 conjugal transfer peptidase TraF [Legionella pneumophila]HAT4435235.1 conjugative transfer signal peptidase TraF [Legionella pneumophila]HAT8603967.1 conjugative transfer signal peptidase TraF [Legionella pneumophila]HAU0130296.1 conjugative transfer signal peptidase TraF [Legionella pneumophila]